MKIKFLKPFRLYNPIGDDMMMGEGAIENMKDDYAEWLIDNGFAKEVDDEWPQAGKHYYTVRSDGDVISLEWLEDRFDEGSQAIGNVFKTEKSAHAYVDYLKAIATVRQDEGVLTPREIESTERSNGAVYCITYTFDSGLFVHTCRLAMVLSQVGAIYFNSRGYAQASLGKHPDEWKIIANYDWSRE